MLQKEIMMLNTIWRRLDYNLLKYLQITYPPLSQSFTSKKFDFQAVLNPIVTRGKN
jgi:hypothetical protein